MGRRLRLWLRESTALKKLLPLCLPCRCVAATTSGSKKGSVYVGKGKFVNDDPNKYPGRTPDNLAGGWAGGEAGLWQFREELVVKARRRNELKLQASFPSSSEGSSPLPATHFAASRARTRP